MQLNVRFQKNFMQKKLCTTSQKFFWLLPKLKTCTSPDHERCIGLIYNVRRSVSFSWNGFLDLKNICGFVLPQFGAVSLDLFPHLGQVQVQVFSEVIQAFFGAFLKLLVLHDLDQFLQQFEVGSLLSFCLLPHAALVVEHEDTEVEDPLEWWRKCCLVRQELGLDNKKGLNTELKEISINT